MEPFTIIYSYSVFINQIKSRRLNENSLENFFGAVHKQVEIRLILLQYNFIIALKKLFSIDYIKVDSRNCAANEESLLFQFVDMKRKQNVILQTSSEVTIFIKLDIDNYDYRNF